jgi:putative phage-type endonuclease
MMSQQSPTVSERQGYIGGSDAGVLLGVSPFGTRMELWAQKTGREVPRPDDPVRNAKFYFGHLLEAPIGQAVQERFGLRLTRAPEPFYRSAAHPFMGAHIDFLLEDGSGFVECKNVEREGAWGEMLPDPLNTEASHLIPAYYLAQCLHYLVVLDRERCYLAALIAGCRLRLYLITRERNAPLIAEMIQAEQDFWDDHVLRDEPPDARTAEDALLRRLVWPRETDAQRVVVVTPEMQAQLAALRLARQREARAKKAAAQARDAVIIAADGPALLRDAAGTDVGRVIVASGDVFDKSRFQAEAPVAYSIWEHFRRERFFFVVKTEEQVVDEEPTP